MRQILRGSPLLLLLIAALASAQPADFRVSSPLPAINGYTPAGSFYPALATSSGGEFLVVWSTIGTKNGDFFAGHAGRRFDASAQSLGAELTFGTFAKIGALSRDVDAATLSTGDFVVAWTQYLPDTSSYVVGQRVSAAGAFLGSSFRVSAYTTGSTGLPRVAADSGGHFVVSFLGPNEGGTGAGVFGRRFQASGAPIGAEFLVATYSTIGRLFAPAVAANATGDFVVVWDAYGTQHDIVGRRFSVGGNALGAEFRVNTYAAGDRRETAVAWDGSGGFVVVWTSPRDSDGSSGIYAQRYSAAGAPVDTEFRVNTYTTNLQGFPTVTGDPGRGFVVAWSSPQDGNLGAVIARRFTASGAPVANEFRVNTYTTGTQVVPAIAATSSGRFVTAWSSLGQYPQYVVYGQRLQTNRGDADGNGTRDVADVFYLINSLFAGGPAPLGPCGGDANGDNVVTVADVFYLINFLFASGPAPPAC